VGFQIVMVDYNKLLYISRTCLIFSNGTNSANIVNNRGKYGKSYL